MKYAIFLFLVLALVPAGPFPSARGSEAAPDCASAVATLAAGIEVHPSEAVVLFQDALRSNPDCRRSLLDAAIRFTGAEPETLTRLIFIARTEFPDDDTLFAGAALSAAPERSREIREAFLTGPEAMARALDQYEAASARAAASQQMDEEIADAIARVTAKAEGKPWPEQPLSGEPLHFRKHDEIRVSVKYRDADESSLANTVPIDTRDEREIVPGAVRLDDSPKRSDELRLDESKFTDGDRSASTAPREAEARSIAPAGAVALPVLPRSGVYYIAPEKKHYRSTIDYESGEKWRPPLVIRPAQVSSTRPQ